jgi:hypothetical protein
MAMPAVMPREEPRAANTALSCSLRGLVSKSPERRCESGRHGKSMHTLVCEEKGSARRSSSTSAGLLSLWKRCRNESMAPDSGLMPTKGIKKKSRDQRLGVAAEAARDWALVRYHSVVLSVRRVGAGFKAGLLSV